VEIIGCKRPHEPVFAECRREAGPRGVQGATPVAIGADGLIVEVHPAPEKAISDGAQSLDLAQFEKMMRELAPYIELWGASRKGEALAAAK